MSLCPYLFYGAEFISIRLPGRTQPLLPSKAFFNSFLIFFFIYWQRLEYRNAILFVTTKLPEKNVANENTGSGIF
jgi:hypothetical protein